MSPATIASEKPATAARLGIPRRFAPRAASTRAAAAARTRNVPYARTVIVASPRGRLARIGHMRRRSLRGVDRPGGFRREALPRDGHRALDVHAAAVVQPDARHRARGSAGLLELEGERVAGEDERQGLG